MRFRFLDLELVEIEINLDEHKAERERVTIVAGSSLAEFIRTGLTIDPLREVRKNDLFEAYEGFCAEHAVKQYERTTFFRKLWKHFGEAVRQERRRIPRGRETWVIGIALADKDKIS